MSGLMVAFVLDQVTGVSSSGAGFFAHQSVNFWNDRSAVGGSSVL